MHHLLRRLVILAGFAGVCVIPCGCGGNPPSPSAGKPPAVTSAPVIPGLAPPKEAPDDDKLPADAPVVALTADEFYQEVAKDEKAAAERFKGKRIEISGEVVSGAGGFLEPSPGSSHAAVGLALMGETFPTVVYGFLTGKDKEPWAKLAAGQKVKLRGVYPETQSTTSPAIRQCQVVEQGPATALAISAEELAKEFAADKGAAAEKYKAKGLVVTGEIVKKEKNKRDQQVVTLKGDQGVEVTCGLPAFAPWMTDPLKAGQKVKLYGVLALYPSDAKKVELDNCLVITQP